ncbi:hypothetical protein [Streptomyces sp. NPDC007083]|uniref:hypothetical protein n=1 Tax=Streptomyces sp. NPDC007083 TaxID=3156913 RepID=UPI00340F72C0
MRRLIRAGYADGVVVTRYSAISPCVEEYEEQLDLIDQHLGFIALMRPEVTEVR